MARISWTEQALDDVEAICEYLHRDAPQYARVIADDIFQAVERLTLFPLSGRIVPEMGREDIREIILAHYRIIYRVVSDEVEVLTVHHSARLLDPSRWPPSP